MNQKTILIPKKISFEIFEKLLNELKEEPEIVDLKIPLELSYNGFGILPAVYSIIFTWMRSKRGKLIIPIKITDEESIKRFTLDFYGYLVLSTVWRHCEIINEEGESLRSNFKKHTPLMHFYIESLSEKLPNEDILIPCFDHYSNEKGLSHWFYTEKFNFWQTPFDFDNSLFLILKHLSKIYTKRLSKNISDSFESLLKIIWELLKNTDEHAKKDHLDQVKLTPNTRGMFLRIQRSSKRNFIDNTNHRGLKTYYESALIDSGQSFILEISIFDSGPGLVKRFLNEKWSSEQLIQEDVDTIRKCLIKGQSSVTNNETKNKGFGLDEVLKLLDQKKGFLKIRTGRVSVYRDLIISPYKPTTTHSEIELYDWIKCSYSNYSEMANVEGTLITLAYPLN